MSGLVRFLIRLIIVVGLFLLMGFSMTEGNAFVGVLALGALVVCVFIFLKDS